MQCLQKTLTWVFFYSIRFTIDLHSKSLFVEILYPMLYPLIFNLENSLSFWKRTSDLKTVELIVFIWVGSGILRRPMEVQPAKSKQYQMLPRTWFFILKTSRIDLKKIEGKKKRNEMRYGMVHRSKSKVTDQGYQGYKRHWMSLTFSTLLVVLNKKRKLKQWEITWQNSDAKMQGLV